MNPNRYVRIVSRLATSLAVIGAGLVANAQTIPPNGQGLPAGAVFNPETRTFTWTPTAAQVGQHQVTFWVTDGIDTDSETITITVTAPFNGNARSDLDGDGNADLLLQSAQGFGVAVQRLNGAGGKIGSEDALNIGGSGAQLIGLADMNGDGTVDYLVKQLAGTKNWQVRYRDIDGNVTGSTSYTPGAGNWELVAAYDQDLDQNPDLIWHNTDTGRVAIWYLDASGVAIRFRTLVSAMDGYRLVTVADFDKDGYMDLLWQSAPGGDVFVAVWLLDASGVRKANGSVSVGRSSDPWRCVAAADYNGDEMVDLLWQNTETFAMVSWNLTSALGRIGATTLSNGASKRAHASWQWAWKAPRPKAWDENADGNADLLWRSNETGTVSAWRYGGGLNRISTGTVVAAGNAQGKIVALADMDNDGVQDYVWAASEAGNTVVRVWLMNLNRTVKQNYVAGSVVEPWVLCAVGDLNSDGFEDLIWQNTSNGQVAVWHMKGSGALRLSTGIIVRDMAGWKLAAVEDMNKDGKDDLIWVRQRATTEVALWRMNGSGAKLSAGIIANVASEWVVGPVADYNNDGNMDMVWFRPDTGQASCTLLDASNVSISENVMGTVAGWSVSPL